MPNNLWQPGQSGNPAGRERGSRNRLSEEVICALLRDFRQHGQKAVARVRQTQPAAYLKILALLVPREHKVEHRNLIKELSDEQLEAMIEFFETSRAAQAGGSITSKRWSGLWVGIRLSSTGDCRGCYLRSASASAAFLS